MINSLSQIDTKTKQFGTAFAIELLYYVYVASLKLTINLAFECGFWLTEADPNCYEA
jgi:hypothetical protein